MGEGGRRRRRRRGGRRVERRSDVARRRHMKRGELPPLALRYPSSPPSSPSSPSSLCPPWSRGKASEIEGSGCAARSSRK